MEEKRIMYVVGMQYTGTMNTFEPIVICGSSEEARTWIDQKMKGYRYNGMGVYTIKPIPYVG